MAPRQLLCVHRGKRSVRRSVFANCRTKRMMTAGNLVILVLYALGMAIGQALFKLSADKAKDAPGDAFWFSLFSTAYFYLSIILYGVLTLIWFWILARMPLSRAYPFVVLAFVFTPILAHLC